MKRHIAAAFFVTVAALALTACQSSQNAPQASNSLKVITINLPDVQFLVHFAKDKGFFDTYKVAPEFLSVQKGADKFLVGNQVDLKIGSMSNLINIYLNGQDPVVLGELNRPSTAYIFSRLPSDKLSEAKKVAVDMFGNDGQYSTFAFLKLHGLDPKKLDIVAIPDDNAKIEMLRAGKLDLAYLSSFKNEDTFSKEFTIFPFYPADSLSGYDFSRAIITNKSALTTKKDAILRFSKAIYAALDSIRTNKEEATAYAVKQLGYNETDAAMFYDRFLKSLE